MSNELKLELDQNGKYVIIVRHENGKHIEDLSQLASQLWDWFHSDDKYIILHPYEGVEIEFHEIRKD